MSTTEAYIQDRDDKGRFFRRRKVFVSRERLAAFLWGAATAGALCGLLTFIL